MRSWASKILFQWMQDVGTGCKPGVDATLLVCISNQAGHRKNFDHVVALLEQENEDWYQIPSCPHNMVSAFPKSV